MDLKFSMNIAFDNISDKFAGHRSKVKVAILENMISDFFLWCDLCRLHRAILSWHLTSRAVMAQRHDVTWRLDILWRLLSKTTDKEGTSREGA